MLDNLLFFFNIGHKSTSCDAFRLALSLGSHALVCTWPRVAYFPISVFSFTQHVGFPLRFLAFHGKEDLAIRIIPKAPETPYISLNTNLTNLSSTCGTGEWSGATKECDNSYGVFRTFSTSMGYPRTLQYVVPVDPIHRSL